MYVRRGDLTHGSIFKLSPDDTRRWRVAYHREGYSFCKPLDLSHAARVSRRDAFDMLSQDGMVWVDGEYKGQLWKLASETGAWSAGPNYLYTGD